LPRLGVAEMLPRGRSNVSGFERFELILQFRDAASRDTTKAETLTAPHKFALKFHF